MKEEIRMQRHFLLRDAEGRNIDAVGKLYRLGGNAKAHFSLTSQHGSNHEDILAAAPDDVRADIEAIVAVHVMDEDGTPMHAASNASYHISQGDFPAAHRALAGAGAIEDLYRVHGEAATAASNGAKAEVERCRALIKDAADTATAFEARIAKGDLAVRRGERTFAFNGKDKESLAELLKGTGAALGMRKLDLPKLKAIAGRMPDDLESKIKEQFRARLLNQGVARYADDTCRPVWEDMVARARQALSAPDYRADGRPAIDEDDTTFEGFAKSLGLEFAFERDVNRRDPDWKDSTFYTWTMSQGGKSMSGQFGKGSAHAYGLSVEDVLESIQMDFSSVASNDKDDFLQELGYTDSIESVRKGERIYDQIVEQREAFVEAFGEDAFRHLLTKVGDNPPLTEDWFEDASPRP